MQDHVFISPFLTLESEDGKFYITQKGAENTNQRQGESLQEKSERKISSNNGSKDAEKGRLGIFHKGKSDRMNGRMTLASLMDCYGNMAEAGIRKKKRQ